MKETKNFFLILFVVIGVATLNPGSGQKTSAVQSAGGEVLGVVRLPVVAETKSVLSPHLVGTAVPPDLSARSVLVRDRNTGKVFLEKHPDKKLPIASLTKLMTAIIVHKNLQFEDKITVEAADIKVPTYRAELIVGSQYAVSDLLSAMLVSSANDATMALARATFGSAAEFVRAMNRQAQMLGMKNTSFSNPVGFDDPAHFSTAFDLSKLVEEFLNYPELTGIVKKKNITFEGRRLISTNKLLLSSNKVIGLKTGYTAEAKGNLILLVDESHTDMPAQFYSIILGSDEREQESADVLKWITENFEWK